MSDRDFVRVRIVTARGAGLVDFVVQYEAVIAGQRYPVVRYDASHGQAHRDLLNARGETIAKHVLNLSYTDALDEALDEIKANFERYRQAFTRRMA